MKIGELQHLSYALAYLAVDMGAHFKADAEIPIEWQGRAILADNELQKLTLDEVDAIVCGEEELQHHIQEKSPKTDELLLDAFDGDLGDVFYENMSCGFAYRDIEANARERRKMLEQGKAASDAKPETRVLGNGLTTDLPDYPFDNK